MRALEKPVWREETRDAFHSTKTLENLETAANSTEISHKMLQKFRKLLNFRNATNSPYSEGKVDHEWKENFLEIFFFETLGLRREVRLFFGNFGKCCSIRLWKLPKIQTWRFGWMVSAQDWLVQKTGLRRLLTLDAIKAEPSFLLLTQKTGLMSPKDWATVTSKAWRDESRAFFSPPYSRRR